MFNLAMVTLSPSRAPISWATAAFSTGPVLTAAEVFVYPTLLTAVLAVVAWRALDTDTDRLGPLLVVQFFGLLAAPVSWSHHWVWVLPLMIWLLNGPWRAEPGARALGWGWFGLTLVNVPGLLALAQPNYSQISRPWYLAWGELVYIAAALVTLGWIVATGRRRV